MSVIETSKIDSMAKTNDGKGIFLLIKDDLDWKDEMHHLKVLQEKIAGYVAFLKNKGYKEVYKETVFQYGVIEVDFQHELTPHAKEYLQMVQNQMSKSGVIFQYRILTK